MGQKKKYDFSGWATKNDLLCADGRTIRKNAFAEQDGTTVPLVWSHDHSSPDNVLGHCLLVNEEEGVRAYGSFNDTPRAQNAKSLIEHGDISSLSINAGHLKHNANRDVLHGVIREVSLVLAGANPGAVIDYPVLYHSGETVYDEAVIFMSEYDADMELNHEDESKPEDPTELNHEDENKAEESAELNHEDESKTEDSTELNHEDAAEKKPAEETNDETIMDAKEIKDTIDAMSEKQRNATYAAIGMALREAKYGEDNDGEDNDEMKHNLFEDYGTNTNREQVLSHEDGAAIVSMAKESNIGTLKGAIKQFAADNDLELMHDAASSGFYQTSPTSGAGNITWLFPEFKDVKPGAPELITYDQGWVTAVLNGVHKSPISRIRTSHADIRDLQELRARGYKKGKQKPITGNFNLVRRTTEPTTVFVKSQLHRDDVIDITDFDYVQYLYGIDRLNLNEELCRAILFGDGREDGAEGKIEEDKIRPIWTDDELYTIHYDLDMEAARAELQGTETDSYFGDNFVRAEALVNACLYSREDFKGTGEPLMFISQHELNIMLLARDRNGRRIYSSRSDLQAAFNVRGIYTIDQMGGTGFTRTVDSKTKKLLCLMVNLADYSLGATKGGEITHFTDFDINFNTLISLLETRCSGALTKIKSAIAIEEDVTA